MNASAREPAIPPLDFLQATLDNPDPNIREWAASILANIGGAASDAAQPHIRVMMKYGRNAAALIPVIGALGLKEEDLYLFSGLISASSRSPDR